MRVFISTSKFRFNKNQFRTLGVILRFIATVLFRMVKRVTTLIRQHQRMTGYRRYTMLL